MPEFLSETQLPIITIGWQKGAEMPMFPGKSNSLKLKQHVTF